MHGLEPLTHLALRVPAVVIASLAVGEQFQRWRLPVITGYLLTGLLAGPWVLGLINPGGLPLVSNTPHPSTNLQPIYVKPYTQCSSMPQNLSCPVGHHTVQQPSSVVHPATLPAAVALSSDHLSPLGVSPRRCEPRWTRLTTSV